MDKTIKNLLDIMNLPDYSHVVVKYKKPQYGLLGLGGGSPEAVKKRFGAYEVAWSYIFDGVYHIVVKVGEKDV